MQKIVALGCCVVALSLVCHRAEAGPIDRSGSAARPDLWASPRARAASVQRRYLATGNGEGPHELYQPYKHEAEGPICASYDDSPSLCTFDINFCGVSGYCTCREGFAYDGVIGSCLKMEPWAEGPKFTEVVLDATDNIVYCARAPTKMCTKDRNACGYPSNCSCESEDYEYNKYFNMCFHKKLVEV